MHHVVVHAHCYQPPREDPWLEIVESEAAAAPDHDWNARITRECYARLAAAEARTAGTSGPDAPVPTHAGLAQLINLYAWCSFDVGATLCEWMDGGAPEVLQAMVAGDAASVRRWGHGNALAAPYHHVILPLASPRDRRTEVRWGIADFQRRFGRTPAGFWLPECAADEDTLDLLAAEGIRFVILAPYQVETSGETHGLPVRWQGASGRSLAIVPYDGGLSGEVAFGGLLQHAEALATRLAPRLDDGQPRCTTLATDGETFGHHHARGDRTLAQAVRLLGQRRDVTLTNAARLVAEFPPTQTARLVSPSSWSCAHGVERWRANCGCRIDGSRAPAQEWRGPLRAALTGVADACHEVFAREGRELFADDPWHVRDAYGGVVAQDGAPLADVVWQSLKPHMDASHAQRAAELLEMERAVLRCFTSCAWFFDDIDRPEPIQVLRYAARALELSGRSAALTPEVIQWLSWARAHTDGSPSAADVFVRDALPHRAADWRVAAGAMALAQAGSPVLRLAVFDVAVIRDGTGLGDTTSVHDAAALQPPDGAPWHVTLRHRRTGAVHQFTGTVTGAGPGLQVHLAPTDHHAPARAMGVHDLPDAVSATLLAAYTLDDRAVLR